MIDSHCHLADAAFADDLEEVINRATGAGLTGALCILAAGNTIEAAQASRVSMLWPHVRFAIGAHPHQSGDFAGRPQEAAALVRGELAGNPLARAIGEIGLDYYYDFSPREVQQAVFRAQLQLARELQLPVIIHTREAEEDTFSILAEESHGLLQGIFHCFTGDRTMAWRALDLGFHVSFAGIVTFPRAAELRDVARTIPADRLLVETDSPYLAPVPHRGRRNEPAWVLRVLETIAELRGESREVLAVAVEATFAGLIRP